VKRIEVLKRSELFRDLDDEQLALIEKMCTAKEFGAGTVVCKQGVIGENTFVIEEGLVAIILEVGPLAQRQIQTATNYETFGWSAMIEPYVSTTTVKALEKTSVLAFNGRELCSLCNHDPETGCKICRAVARVIGERLRQAYIQLLGVTQQD
jgi:CRP/FNR family transcriptional regulator, cyclic AMP receptor protein